MDGSGNQVTVLGDGNESARAEGPEGTIDGSDTAADDAGTDQTGADGSATTGGDPSLTGSGAQGGPAVPVAGILPQTGAAAGLLGWAATGAAVLLLGLALTLFGRRHTDGPGRGRTRLVA